MFEAIRTCIGATEDDLGFEKCQRNPDLIENARKELEAMRALIEELEYHPCEAFRSFDEQGQTHCDLCDAIKKLSS